MKKAHISTLLLITVLFPLLLLAKGPGGGGGMGGGPGSGSGLGGPHMRAVSAPPAGMATLDALLNLSNDELKQLEDTIRRIREMSPEERQAFKDRISQYRQMPEEEKESLQVAWGQLDARVRSAWREYMFGLDEAERESVRTRLHAIDPEERTQWRIDVLRKAGLLPDDLDW